MGPVQPPGSLATPPQGFAHRLRWCILAWALWGGLIVAMALMFAPSQEPFIYFQF